MTLDRFFVKSRMPNSTSAMTSAANNNPSLSEPILRYQNAFFEVYETKADFGSSEKVYYTVDFGRRVGAIVSHKNKILMVRQYRFFLKGNSWEIPGGSVKERENTKSAVIRECHEESGILLKDPKTLLSYNVGHEGVDNPTDVFYAENFEVDDKWAATGLETIEVHWVELETCLKMIEMGEISDSLSILAILAYNTTIHEQFSNTQPN